MSLAQLYAGLQRRRTPEDVWEEVAELLKLDAKTRKIGPQQPAWMKSWYGSRMSQDWEQVASLDKPLGVLGEITNTKPPAGDDPEAIRNYLAELRPLIGKDQGKSSYKHDRLNRAQRKAAGLDLSRRQYDKLFRLMGRLETYADELEDQQSLNKYKRFAKQGLGADMSFEDFAKSPSTGAFIAYHNATASRRSLFIAGPQARAFDKAAEYLLKRAQRSGRAGWYGIAHAYPRPDVLDKLTLAEKYQLLSKVYGVMADIAKRLQEIANDPNQHLNIEEMVVHAGNDSSTWNDLAGAWNKARDMWISVTDSIDPTLTDAVLPGKVLRLMAHDVVRWHRALGNELDPDTRVWNELPRPWEVWHGQKTSTKQDVIDACKRAGVDPDASGWVKGRKRTQVSEVTQTPESVHGVVVNHPELASLLRKSGWFSGSRKAGTKPLPTGTPDFEVITDHTGAVVEVEA